MTVGVGLTDPYRWLESEADARTLHWVATETRRIHVVYPDRMTQALQAELERAMAGRLGVKPPVQHAGQCYRYDAHRATWMTSPAPLSGPPRTWRPLSFGDPEVDTALAADLLPCPFPSGDHAMSPRAIVTVTHEGTDATSSAEVDLTHGTAVAGGLRVPACVHQVSWDGPDSLLVSHRSHLASGFHWVVDRVRRGAGWEGATRLHSFPQDRVAASIVRDATADDSRYLMTEWLDHRRRIYRLGRESSEGITWTRIQLPEHVRLQLLGDLALLVPLLPWRLDHGGETSPAGSLLSSPVADLTAGTATPRMVFHPSAGQRMLSLAASRHRVLVVARDRVSTRLLSVDPSGSGVHEVAHTDAATRMRASPVDVHDAECADAFWVESAGPVTPPELAYVRARPPVSRRIVESGTPTFRHSDFAVHHHRLEPAALPPVEVTVVAPRDLPLDGENPTVLTGYGAFAVPGHLDYLDLTGPSWLDRPTPDGRRCVYAFAHVGAGLRKTTGPWERLTGSVAQFLAVAERLEELGIARPARLGVLGVSHGGLLIMNAVLDRPAAFGAVVCRSAVLDLLGYPRLDGTAWTEEYGDPRDPASRPALRALSPYHRISPGQDYPPVLLWSAANDDRVSPAHSRKVAARLTAVGAEAHYLETSAGGHDSLAASPVGAHGLAVTASFFRRHLVEQPRDVVSRKFPISS